MSDEEFRALLDLWMCSDPWPVTDISAHEVRVCSDKNHALVTGLLDREATNRGYTDVVDAYHSHKPVTL